MDATAYALSHIAQRLLDPVRNAFGIEEEVQNLLHEGRELRYMMNDMERSVAAARRQQWEPTHQATEWLEKAASVLSQLEEFESWYWDWRDEADTGGLIGFLTCGCGPLCFRRRLREHATELLMRVRGLKEQRGCFEVVVEPPPLAAVLPTPVTTSKIIGRRGTQDAILRCLRDDSAGILGICGMGGVGKTTLLKAVNNAIYEEGGHGFDLVIWATVSRDFRAEKLQRDIARRCDLSPPDDEGNDWRHSLFNFLFQRRFVLILDDVWEAFDLSVVGIPRRNARNSNKILFSTRSEYVCNEMDADWRIQVDPLNEGDSWTLFQTRVPKEVLEDSPSIQQHAKELVALCGGLPIALITVGRAMAYCKAPLEWKFARKAPMELRGMKEVIAILELSFDGLSGDLPKECLLHCASQFPADYDIDMEQLVDSLMKGRLLCDDKVEDAGARGYAIIRELKALLLLQTGSDGNNLQVKIHPLVRIMALSIIDRHTYV